MLSPNLSGHVDLHTHTNESDGSLTPAELIQLATAVGLDGLAITDHDTFDGFEKALPLAQEAGLALLCGIELNTRLLNPDHEEHTRNLHLLAYFPSGQPGGPIHRRLEQERSDRRERNMQLVLALQRQGIDIRLEEVEARGRSLTGRPHFARILVEKGYARNQEDAFHRFLGEQAPTYVERQSHSSEEAIEIVRASGGIPVIAHPIRLMLSADTEKRVLARLKEAGLLGLEVHHSDQSADAQAHYASLAAEFELIPTGGSDFHGAAKPNVTLGTGLRDNVRVPRAVLDRLFAHK